MAVHRSSAGSSWLDILEIDMRLFYSKCKKRVSKTLEDLKITLQQQQQTTISHKTACSPLLSLHGYSLTRFSTKVGTGDHVRLLAWCLSWLLSIQAPQPTAEVKSIIRLITAIVSVHSVARNKKKKQFFFYFLWVFEDLAADESSGRIPGDCWTAASTCRRVRKK